MAHGGIQRRFQIQGAAIVGIALYLSLLGTHHVAGYHGYRVDPRRQFDTRVFDEAVDEGRFSTAEATGNAEDGLAGDAREIVEHVHLGKNRLHLEYRLGFIGQ